MVGVFVPHSRGAGPRSIGTLTMSAVVGVGSSFAFGEVAGVASGVVVMSGLEVSSDGNATTTLVGAIVAGRFVGWHIAVVASEDSERVRFPKLSAVDGG